MNGQNIARRLAVLALTGGLALGTAVPSSAFLFGGKDAAETAGEAAVASFSKNALAGQTISFSADDLRVEAAGGVSLDQLVIASLPDPAAGVLTLGGIPLGAGDTVALSAVDGLAFRPAGDEARRASFTFAPVFSNGTSGREVSVDLILLAEENSAPVAEELSLTTYKDTALTARFAAVDPEGDLLTYRLVDKPARGAVELPADGSDCFVYTPYEGKTGRDSFTYVATDAVGNTSAPAKVTVKIQKPSTKVRYADMDGDAAANAALRLAEAGIFVGERMGDRYLFRPEAAVSRSQFVAMVMAAAQVETLEDVSRTGFADDSSIPQWAKPYAASALRAGLVQGVRDEAGQTVFRPDAPVTRAEASVLLDRVLQITDVAQSTLGAELEEIPVWAAQPVANLESCGIPVGTAGTSGPLTRGEAAQLLAGAMDVLAARETGGWTLFG
ncbi:Ig-like domain-containing protein [Pseudoflavonifractor sp. MSJ-37]|uniref:Ig-like domain-containing protein n=1 Tax=Pseudoflavonifractor sp. MSJ-37 TaxID=2841531 RepID=UPI002738542C|nr:Ig-like domain-containing protein [Pseudoflavonifractor sp. MSJ-37]